MQIASSMVAALLMLSGCVSQSGHVVTMTERKASAERFFRGVYGCDPPAVDDLAADDIVVSYPNFETIFGMSAIRGREAVKKFANGFCQRWADAQITIHEAIGDGKTVVLLWSFRGRNVGSRPDGPPATNQEHSWGGITLFRFDKDGKIVAEIGEESDPGPVHRVGADAPDR